MKSAWLTCDANNFELLSVDPDQVVVCKLGPELWAWNHLFCITCRIEHTKLFQLGADPVDQQAARRGVVLPRVGRESCIPAVRKQRRERPGHDVEQHAREGDEST